MEKPNVLILGGCGFIGRNLVSFLLSEELVSSIRIVDKVPPQMAWLNSSCQKNFDNPLVEYRSANLINPDSCGAVFDRNDNRTWDLVINCASETKFGQNDAVYEDGIFKLSLNCAKEAARRRVHHYFEFSSGCMFSADKEPLKEDGPVKPWGFAAEWKRKVEKALPEIEYLSYTILRLPIVYGLGDRHGLTPRIVVAAIYKELNETMQLLWNADLGIGTVHVEDVCRAIWFCYSNHNQTVGQIFNVVDEELSTQGSITTMLCELFSIKAGYYGNLLSKVVNREDAANEANEKHLKIWATACRRDGIENTPLAPHMHPEALLHKHLRLDGDKLRQLGFSVKHPKPHAELMRIVVEDFAKMGIFPPSLCP